MADRASAADGDRVRRWLSNWRTVNAVQDDLVRAAAAPDPVACLERGLSLIALTRPGGLADPETAHRREMEAAAARRTWRRIRAAYER